MADKKSDRERIEYLEHQVKKFSGAWLELEGRLDAVDYILKVLLNKVPKKVIEDIESRLVTGDATSYYLREFLEKHMGRQK